jgi:hypothetical protein
MTRTDCQNVRREIDEAATGEQLTLLVREHLSSCAACAKFANEHRQIRDMVASLEGIKAPADFDFRLRARLAESRAARRGLLSGNRFMGGFGIRSVAFATLVLLLGFAVVLINVRSRSNQSGPVAANGPAPQTGSKAAQTNQKEQREVLPTVGAEVAVKSPTSDTNSSELSGGATSRNKIKRGGTSMSQYAVARNARNQRVKATDLSATAARVWRPTETVLGSSVFPLGTSYQSLKVSVDDGRGSSRTISLPSVSFGSSRVLARNPAPVTATMRDSW